jgi:tetratricopeptide (TPR) repeat protein
MISLVILVIIILNVILYVNRAFVSSKLRYDADMVAANLYLIHQALADYHGVIGEYPFYLRLLVSPLEGQSPYLVEGILNIPAYSVEYNREEIGYRLEAIPRNAKDKHFFLDQRGTIHARTGISATVQDPIYPMDLLQTLVRLGNYWIVKKDYEMAEIVLRGAYALDERSVNTIGLLAFVLSERKQLEEGLVVLQKGMEMYPDNQKLQLMYKTLSFKGRLETKSESP